MGTIHLRDGLVNGMLQTEYHDRNPHTVSKFI